MLNTNMALTDLQFSSILTSLANLPLQDPDKCLQQAIFLRNRTARTRRGPCLEPFWLHPRFQAWAQSPSSALIMVQGTFAGQAAMKDCLVNIIEQIRLANATALWALKTSSPSASPSLTTVELLKYLTSQALRQGPPPTERSLTLSYARFQSARDECEWIALLAASLANLGHVFLVVDIELLVPETCASPGGFTLPLSIAELFLRLGRSSSSTVVKVMLVSYGSPLFGAISDAGTKKQLLLAGKRKPQRPVGKAPSGRNARFGRGRLRRGLGFEQAIQN